MKAGKIGYGVVFCLVLPALLWVWAGHARVGPAVPVVHWPVMGWALTVGSVGWILRAMWELWRIGGGLPMNAYPPERLVISGPFAVVRDPIYLGFVGVCAGVSIAVGSVGGVWVVTPAAALGCAALVWGYEREALRKRVGNAAGEVEEEEASRYRRDACATRLGRWRPWLSFATDENAAPGWGERWAGAVMVLGPWLVLYEGIGHVRSQRVVSTWMGLDASWPVVGWTEAVYALAYVMAIAAPLLAARRADLRRWEISGVVAMAVGFWMYLSLPGITPPKGAVGGGVLRWMQEFERADGLEGRAAMPSFHVCWVMLAAAGIGTRGRAWRIGAWALAAGIAASCLTTGMHGIADVVAGAGLFLAAHFHGAIWRWLRRGSEVIANAWHERRFGPVRVLVAHALYAGGSALVGMLLCGVLLGEEWTGALAAVAIAGLVGGGVWGQVFEASGKLSRPFGYYGNVLGVWIGITAVWWGRGGAWPLVAALATAAPWVQGIGRLRCLVQGCCHGRGCAEGVGIRYVEPRSRVCALSDLGGRPVHATQLYSVLINVWIGGPLLRLWSAGAEASVIVGLYLLLSGLGRFVEESYRGEPQTAIIGGMRAYQWLAVVFVVAGAVVMCVPSQGVEVCGGIEWGGVMMGIAVAIVYGAAMGVDFPGVQRRLARLAG